MVSFISVTGSALYDFEITAAIPLYCNIFRGLGANDCTQSKRDPVASGSRGRDLADFR